MPTPPEPAPVVPPPLPTAADDMFAGVEGSAHAPMPSAAVESAITNSGAAPVLAVAPHGGKGKTIAIVAVLLLVLGGGGAAAYWYMLPKGDSAPSLIPVSSSGGNGVSGEDNETTPYGDDGLGDETGTKIPEVVAGNDTNSTTPSDSGTTSTTTGTNAIAEPSTPVAPIVADGDGDGLTDEEEARYGTSSRKPDTDNDGLFDREEVLVYKTNPLSPDTDGDTYTDGSEVQKGYNPNGQGKLLNTPSAQ